MKWCSSRVRWGLCINRLVILKLQVIGIDKRSHGRRRPAMLLAQAEAYFEMSELALMSIDYRTALKAAQNWS